MFIEQIGNHCLDDHNTSNMLGRCNSTQRLTLAQQIPVSTSTLSFSQKFRYRNVICLDISKKKGGLSLRLKHRMAMEHIRFRIMENTAPGEGEL